MGFKDLWEKITGHSGPKLAKASGEISQQQVKHLKVFTAEAMVIVELGAADVDKVLFIASSNEPGALVAGSTTVIFVPTKRDVLPVKDPKRGWILPVGSEVADRLQAIPGDYEINAQIAFVIT